MLPTGQGSGASHQRGRLYGFIQTGAFYNLEAPTTTLAPKGETTHYNLCVALLLQPLLSLTHWIFRSLMLPYKSSSHSANHVRCARQRRVKLKPLKNLRPSGPSTLKPHRGLSISRQQSTPHAKSAQTLLCVF